MSVSRSRCTAVECMFGSLLEQSSLDFLPGVLAALVCVHAKQDTQAARQAAGLLLQQVGLRLSFETFNAHRHKGMQVTAILKSLSFPNSPERQQRTSTEIKC